MAKLYTQLSERCDFSSDADPLSAYPGSKFTNIANNYLKASGGLCVCRATGPGICLYTFNTATTPPANSAVEANFVSSVTGYAPAFVFRYVNSTNFYMARNSRPTNQIELYKFVNNTPTQIGFYTVTQTEATIYVECADEAGTGHTDINVFLDSTLRIAYHDTAPFGYGAASLCGIRWGWTTVGGSIDNLTVYVAATAAGAAYWQKRRRMMI